MINNKKAQEGPGLSTLVGLAVVIIAAVLIILFLTGFFGKLSGGGNQLPSALAAKATVCKQVANNNAAFCEFTELKLTGLPSGVKSYVNCIYPNTDFQAEIAKSEIKPLPECKTAEAEFCGQFLLPEAKSKIFINGKVCPN